MVVSSNMCCRTATRIFSTHSVVRSSPNGSESGARTEPIDQLAAVFESKLGEQVLVAVDVDFFGQRSGRIVNETVCADFGEQAERFLFGDRHLPSICSGLLSMTYSGSPSRGLQTLLRIRDVSRRSYAPYCHCVA
jgi:hypothetical protein